MIAAGDRVEVDGRRGVALAGGGHTVPVRFDGYGPPESRTEFVDVRKVTRDNVPQDRERTMPAADLRGEIERLTSALSAAEAKAALAAMERDRANMELREARRTMQGQASVLDAIGSLLKQRFAEG